MKLFTDEMDKCEHPTTWPDGTCPDCKWNMWEAYGANQEEVDRANEIKVLKGLSKDALIAQLKASQDEVSRLEKIIDDFDGSVRHLMTATPQLETILKNNLIRIKSKYNQASEQKGEG